jgi:N-acetylglucosamine transport system substrate-binding protein
MSEIFGKPSELDRRTLLRRAAAVGLLATPAVGMLSACVGSSSDTQQQSEGTKSATNPLGIDPKSPIEVIIFNGGLGTKYATDVDIPSYNKSWPD